MFWSITNHFTLLVFILYLSPLFLDVSVMLQEGVCVRDSNYKANYKYDVRGAIGVVRLLQEFDLDISTEEVSAISGLLNGLAHLCTIGGILDCNGQYSIQDQGFRGIKIAQVTDFSGNEDLLNGFQPQTKGKIFVLGNNFYQAIQCQLTIGGSLRVLVVDEHRRYHNTVVTSFEKVIRAYNQQSSFSAITLTKQFLFDMSQLANPERAEEISSFYGII